MSDLEFFDVMRMFMGEMLNRGYNMDERQIILQNCIEALKTCLPVPGQGVKVNNPFADAGFADGGDGYADPSPQSPQQYQQEPQYDQQYDEPPPEDMGRMQDMPPEDEEPMGGGGGGGLSDDAILQSISQVVYATGQRVNQLYKEINVDGGGVQDHQLTAGLAKLGVKCLPADIIRVSQPYKGKNGKIGISGFIRMLAAGGDS